MEHTKLPWTKDNHKVSFSWWLSGEDGESIGSMNEEADAEFIVKACNEFYRDKQLIKELLEACKELLNWRDDARVSIFRERAKERVKRAISKAEKGER